MNIHDVGNDNDQQQHNANEAGNDGLLLEYYTMDDIDIPTLPQFGIVQATNPSCLLYFP